MLAHRQGQLQDVELLDPIRFACELVEHRVRLLPGPDELPAPAGLRRVVGRPVQQVFKCG